MENRLSLFDLQKLYFDTEEELESNGGELTPEIEAALETTREMIPRKIDSYKGYLDFLDARVGLLDETIKQLQAKKKAAKNAKESIRSYVADTMQAFGLDRIKGDIYTATLRKSKSIEVDEDLMLAPYARHIQQLESKLPDYLTVEIKVSKTALKEAIKAEGVMPAGVAESESLSLTIR